VTDEEQVNAFVHKGLAEFGRIDVVVNNAGWRARGDLLHISTENWLATMGVNLHAPFLMSQAVLPSMVQHPGDVLSTTLALPPSVAPAAPRRKWRPKG
jgi:NAD(P)-dependent dehydrogenase (short-subunit alcohol dehydrogenase family)